MSIDVNEQSILQALHRVPQDKWDRVLKFLHNLEPKTAEVPEGAELKCWTAEELLALPLDERDVILEAQALLAVDLYPIGLDDDYSDYDKDTDASTR
jgi:hypothetical protein